MIPKALEMMAEAIDNPSSAEEAAEPVFTWTTVTILQAIALFVLTAFAEIGGGWLVWHCVRSRRDWYWGVAGSIVLVIYGFLPTLQPSDDSFGRIYAVYGGFFILLSFLAGWVLDGDKPDLGDLVGGLIALVGVLVVLFWPR